MCSIENPTNRLDVLNLQRLCCETIYYFYKYSLITLHNLGLLISHRVASRALSRHILKSYQYDQPKEWKSNPIWGRNILRNWYKFSCGNMFLGK